MASCNCTRGPCNSYSSFFCSIFSCTGVVQQWHTSTTAERNRSWSSAESVAAHLRKSQEEQAQKRNRLPNSSDPANTGDTNLGYYSLCPKHERTRSRLPAQGLVWRIFFVNNYRVEDGSHQEEIYWSLPSTRDWSRTPSNGSEQDFCNTQCSRSFTNDEVLAFFMCRI